MKKVLSLVLILITVIAVFAFPPATGAAARFDVPFMLREDNAAAESAGVFTFSTDCGSAREYELERRRVYDFYFKRYGSDEAVRAAMRADGLDELLCYPAVLAADIETGGSRFSMGVYDVTAQSLTVTLDKDVLPAMLFVGHYDGSPFTFELIFYAAIRTDDRVIPFSDAISFDGFSCPATVHVSFSVPADAENPNLSFPPAPFSGMTLAYPTRPGYAFAGWLDETAGRYVSRVEPDMLDHTFTAQWTPRTYKINYVLATREGYVFVQVRNPNPLTRVFGEETPLYDLTPPYGYLFEGWYETADFSGDPVSAVPADRLGDTVLYAKWGTQAETEDALIAEKGYGDVNGDGAVTAADARLALRAAVKLETFTPAQLERANLTGTGAVNAGDAREILRVAVGLETVKSVLKYYGVLSSVDSH